MTQDWSQSGEEEHILRWAEGRGYGLFLDCGAADGTSASNTRALAERGWGGVCVEAAASMFQPLADLYASRDDIECVQAAVVIEPSPLVRFYSSHDLVSTTEDRNRATWAELVAFNPIYVAAITVPQLLAVLPGPYDFITVDTEGTSLEITRALLDADALAPGGLLCVECEDGGERWIAQQWCLEGLARVAVSPNNLLLERL